MNISCYPRFIAILALLNGFSLSKEYKGAELRTAAEYLYGRFEVNYKASHGPGQTSTFFTYHELGADGIQEWNELDIEILGRYPDDVQFNTITPGQINHVHHQWVGFDPSADFHTYAIEWTPDYVAWFVDNIEVHRQVGEYITTLNKSQKIMMNIWPPEYTGWVGNLDDRQLPFFAYYDWVSYAAYIPGAGNVGTNNNFSLQWRDEFDDWNQSRWQKATHTWDGNNSDFIPENCVFQDGLMILCLTAENQVGHVDKNAPFVVWARYESKIVTVMFSEEITQASAENIANYNISGVVINRATLQPDCRSVKLNVSGIDESKNYKLVCMGIKDCADPANTLLAQVVNIQMPPVWNYPLKINVGGNATDGWLEDQEWSDNRNYGQIGGTKGQSPGQAIAGTEDDIIYQTEQYGLVKYQVRLLAGKYDITLMMSENYFQATAKRIFNINLEGNYIAQNLDLFNEVGSHTAYTIENKNVQVNDGILDIHFGANQDNALLNGLIINQGESDINFNNSPMFREFKLGQNYPNPFNSSTAITYQLAESAVVSITIFDLLGSRVTSLINQKQTEGYHVIQWEAAVPSGIYFYQINAKSNQFVYNDIKKMVLMK
jgi:hypothetical protein